MNKLPFTFAARAKFTTRPAPCVHIIKPVTAKPEGLPTWQLAAVVAAVVFTLVSVIIF